ncbi:hypothetical protein ACIBKZ_15635 [Streptomyces sp. NPDC050421]|uniref:hypothetical protein n=1 Tax=Streptomyces sp. NPDC050421 TaxID=3365613 RepID=UPI0037BC570D
MSVKAPAGYFVSFIGSGKVTHAINQDGPKASRMTLCGKAAGNAVDASRYRPDGDIACKTCQRKSFEMNATPLHEIDITTIPGLVVPTGRTNGESSNDMAAKTMDKDAQAKAEADVRDSFERLTSLVVEGDADKITELVKSLTNDTNKITGTGAAAIKAKLRADIDKTVKDAEAAKPKAEVATKADTTPSLATEDYTKVPGLVELVSEGSKLFKEGVAHESEKGARAKRLAQIDLDMRLNILNKDGVPDLHAKSDQAKRASGDLLNGALEGVEKTFENDKLFKAMQRSKQNAMSDTLVQYVRALDNSPEEFGKYFGKIAEAHPDLSPTEAVFTFYGLPRKSQNELKAEKYAATKALEAAAKAAGKTVAELAASTPKGEGEGEGEGEGNGDAAAKKTAGAKLVEHATKANDEIGKALEEKAVKKLTNDEKRALKKQLEAIALRANSAALALVIEDDADDDEDDEDGDDA